ncbi:hypothetical protein [Caminibacter sp.]
MIYPLSFLVSPINTRPITFNPDYVEHIQALNLLDYFTPTQFASNPLFAQVDELNQNIGVLQTASNSIEKILTIIDTIKQINNPTEDVLKELADEINSTIKNTTFDNLPVFSQSLKIGDDEIKLAIPEFAPDTNIEDYEKILLEKQKDIFEALKNLNTLNPFENNLPNPENFETFLSLLNNGSLLQAYNTELINPENLQLLFS